MRLIICFFKYISKSFSPSFIYTLDKSFVDENKETYTFKEFGTHTYIMKTWSQLQESDFIRELNPKDIMYIAQVEVRRSIEGSRLRISEEKRGGVYILSCENMKISVTAKDFLNDYSLVSRTEYHDVVRIAYSAGVKKGRVISSCFPDIIISSHHKNEKPVLTVIK